MQSFRAIWFGVMAVLVFTSNVEARALPDFTDIVEKNREAVVKINTVIKGKRGQSNGYGRGQEQLPDIFRDFFQNRGQPQQRDRQAMGSGFILSEDGYILTNHHVIDGADEIIVRLVDRREFDAELVGTDARSDLALLKVKSDESLPTVVLGKPREIKVGEWVLAIGSPFGLDYSVSAGIVSAKGRSLPSPDRSGGNYVPFIQTDVAINPGNSGGPLFNMRGEVVGINSQIYTRSGGSIGLSFAIPIEVALNVVEQLKENGAVTRGWLGVVIQDVDRDLAEAYGLDKPRGALISQIDPEGPGASSGLKEGDIILTFNGRDIIVSADLPHVVGLTPAGSKAKAQVLRDGKRKTLTITVGSLEGDSIAGVGVNSGTAAGGRLGLVVDELDEETKEKWSLLGGVTVNQVLADKPGAEAGLRPGDVITLINNRPVSSVERYREIVAELPSGRPVPLRIVRRGRPGFVAIRID